MNNLAAMGGPAGAQQMQNAGTPTSIPSGNAVDNRRKLHTYIYDYFLKNEMFDLARALYKEVDIESVDKQSPNRKDVNGAPDGMDTDTKSDNPNKPSDLPNANVPVVPNGDSSFLFDWWAQFWDCWTASRMKTPSPAKQYIHHVQNQRMANDRQRGLMSNPQMQAMQARNGMLPNGKPMPPDMKMMMMQQQGQRQVNPQQMAQLRLQQQQQQLAQQTQMQREGSQIDMNGQPRPQTPGSGEAPSPKRQRLEGAVFNGQMGPMGRGQNPGMPGAQFNGMPMQVPGGPAKNMQVYANQMQLQQMQLAMNSDAQKGMQNPAGLPQGSPAIDQNGEMFNQNQMRTMNQPGANSSNHALQDYQMQLMLLEQQNKKRLLMARQEQDSQTGPGVPMPGQPGFGAPAMSPSNSRTGPSPNPDDQMKRGTPKMAHGGIPPGMEGMQGRASPAPGFDPSQMNPNMPPNFQGMKMPGAVLGPNGQLMAATSHPAFNAQMNGHMNGLNPQQMEMMRQQAAAARGGPNGPWQGPPPGMIHPGQPQQPPNMTPQQRNSAMPPPPAPATGDNQNRTQPSSPQQNAAPPTPSQTNKPNPKKKNDAKGGKKAAAKKNTNATAATPASEAGDQPPTPTPAPPITPTAPSQQFPKGAAGQGANAQQAAGSQGVVANQVPQPDMSAGPFGSSLDAGDMNFGMDFGAIDGQDVLDNFDFDTFLNQEGGDGGFSFDNMGFPADPGLEAGADV